MGGFGSGRPGHRAIIECGLTIDLRRLRAQGIFKDGGFAHGRTLTWSNGAACKVSYDAGEPPYWFRVTYTAGSGDEAIEVDDRITLAPFPQPFGGSRWYFICPSSGARAQCLHCPPGATRFRSLKAYRGRVRYLSQGLERGDRCRRQGDKLRRRMLEAGPPDWRDEHQDWEFPPKPPGMRWGTYSQAFERWEDYEGASDTLALARVMRITGTR